MLVILWVFALLRCALGWWWWHDVHKLIFLRRASCCSMYGGSVGYGNWVGSWVHKFTWQWVELGWFSYLVGWVGLMKIGLRTTLQCTQHMIHIPNQHDPRSALMHISFTLIVCWQVPLWRKFRIKQSEVNFSFSQPCYESRQKQKLKLKISNAETSDKSVSFIWESDTYVENVLRSKIVLPGGRRYG